MKLTKELEYEVSVRAVFDGKNLTLKLTGTMPYGKRTASATIQVTDKKLLEEVKNVLANVLESEAEKAGISAENAAAISRMAAINLGEVV